MFSSKQFRAKAAEHAESVKETEVPGKFTSFQGSSRV